MSAEPKLSGLSRKLVNDGLLDEEKAITALKSAHEEKISFTQYLVNNNVLSASRIAMEASNEFGLPVFDLDSLDKEAVERVVLCSGKVYYDLRAARRERGLENIAILRLEQLYPFPEQELLATLSAYPNLVDAVWCQEEPMNQGAWYASQHHMRRVIHQHKVDVYLRYVGREASAAPAAGYMALHVEQQEAFIDEALGEIPSGH